MSEEGPFRTAEPTADARLASEREASLERVYDVTAEAIERERRSAARRESLSGAAFALSLLVAIGVVSAATFESVAWPFVCPALALVMIAGIVLFRRRKR